MHGNIISAPFGSRILSLSLGSYSTDRPCTAFSGTYQPTLFSFEISRLWLRRRRHRGRRGAASATSSSSIPNPLSLLPFLISPGLPITGRTDGRQWFNNPLKDYSFLRSNIPTKLNICHSRKKWGSKVRQMTQEAEKNCNSACRSSRNRNIKATCFVRSDDIALALLTGRGRSSAPVRCSTVCKCILTLNALWREPIRGLFSAEHASSDGNGTSPIPIVEMEKSSHEEKKKTETASSYLKVWKIC